MIKGELYVADGPLTLASGHEIAKILPLEVVMILIPEKPGSQGNVYVVGLESHQEQYIAATSLTKADPDASLAEKAALIVAQTIDTTEWETTPWPSA